MGDEAQGIVSLLPRVSFHSHVVFRLLYSEQVSGHAGTHAHTTGGCVHFSTLRGVRVKNGQTNFKHFKVGWRGSDTTGIPE